jgi:hypothetical protein
MESQNERIGSQIEWRLSGIQQCKLTDVNPQYSGKLGHGRIDLPSGVRATGGNRTHTNPSTTESNLVYTCSSPQTRNPYV